MASPPRWVLATLLLGTLGCQARDDTPVTARDGDATLFEAEVQPVLQHDCAFVGCHGREGVSLTLYAVDHLRMIDPEGLVDPTRPALDERAVSESELEHNRLAIAARKTADDPEAEQLLRRLLPEEEGGVAHADGTVVYDRPSADGYRALERFMETVDAR